jgi:hypothetical protein
MMLKGKDETLVIAVLSDHYGVLCEEQRGAKKHGHAKRADEVAKEMGEINDLLTRWISETTV